MSSDADRVTPIDLLMPYDIPSPEGVVQWLKEGSSHEEAIIFQSAVVRSDGLTNLDVQKSLEKAHATTGPSASHVESANGQAEDAAHDVYFCVRRVNGLATEIFANSAIMARLVFLRETVRSPATVAISFLDEIDHALADLAVEIAGNTKQNQNYVSTWEPSDSTVSPMVRWVVGHQIFAMLSQGLIYSFRALGQAIRSGNNDEILRWADLSICLLRGSGAAFVWTGDFSTEEYMNTVRPSMMPPVSSLNLSGLMSIDHRVFVQTVRDLTPALKALHEHHPDRHDRLRQELSEVYSRHIHVCERFVGERPSLLTERHAKKSGPELIEQFKKLRMKAFEAPHHVQRLVATAEAPVPQTSSTKKCPFDHAPESEPQEIESV
jgi:hypothetical protein